MRDLFSILLCCIIQCSDPENCLEILILIQISMKNIRNSFHFEYENIVMKISIKDNSLNSSRDNRQMGMSRQIRKFTYFGPKPCQKGCVMKRQPPYFFFAHHKLSAGLTETCFLIESHYIYGSENHAF